MSPSEVDLPGFDTALLASGDSDSGADTSSQGVCVCGGGGITSGLLLWASAVYILDSDLVLRAGARVEAEAQRVRRALSPFVDPLEDVLSTLGLQDQLDEARCGSCSLSLSVRDAA